MKTLTTLVLIGWLGLTTTGGVLAGLATERAEREYNKPPAVAKEEQPQQRNLWYPIAGGLLGLVVGGGIANKIYDWSRSPSVQFEQRGDEEEESNEPDRKSCEHSGRGY